jgi:hypothetical protein
LASGPGILFQVNEQRNQLPIARLYFDLARNQIVTAKEVIGTRGCSHFPLEGVFSLLPALERR